MKRKIYIPILAFFALLGIALIVFGVVLMNSCSKDNTAGGNVMAETIKSNGTVYSTRTVTDVPLQRNKVTVLRGPMYSNASGASFTVSTSWVGDMNFVDF